MNSKIKISVVSFLNSKPFIYGIEHSSIKNEIDLQLDTPATCAQKLLDGSVDIGLVPIAVIPELPAHHIITDYCIGADGNVGSVLLLSEVPLNKIETVLMDFRSRTSVKLAQLLASKFWKIKPEWKVAEPGFEKRIQGSTAGIIIGDRALEVADQYKYRYDLADEWKSFTGLPFVFACWISNKTMAPNFISSLNEAFQNGVSNPEAVISEIGSIPVNHEIALDYLRNRISYGLDEKKREAMELFLAYQKELMGKLV